MKTGEEIYEKVSELREKLKDEYTSERFALIVALNWVLETGNCDLCKWYEMDKFRCLGWPSDKCFEPRFSEFTPKR